MTRNYERISQQLLLRNKVKAKPFCIFENGHLYVGTKSLHRNSAARVWRLFWRLKANRNKLNESSN